MDDGIDFLKRISDQYYFYLCQMGIIDLRYPHKLFFLLHGRRIKNKPRPSLQQLYAISFIDKYAHFSALFESIHKVQRTEFKREWQRVKLIMLQANEH